VDPVKYRNLFLEEATEHLAEVGRALLALEKNPRDGAALDLVFRMVHSLKGMGASLGYDAVSDLSHRLEDRLGAWRARGGIDDPQGLPLLFRALESLERMVARVRETSEPPPPDPELIAAIASGAKAAATGPPEEGAGGAKKATARAR
jgi:two-component system chemotaxis sensor kinase CheA